MDQITHSVRHSIWKDIILQCQNRPTGMPAKKWMQENQISEKSYYYWQRKFRNEIFSQKVSSSIALPALQEHAAVSFAELPMTKEKIAPPENLGEVMHPSAVIKTATLTIALSNDISDSLLSRILQEVSHA